MTKATAPPPHLALTGANPSPPGQPQKQTPVDDPLAEVEIKLQLKSRGRVAKEEDLKPFHQLLSFSLSHFFFTVIINLCLYIGLLQFWGVIIFFSLFFFNFNFKNLILFFIHLFLSFISLLLFCPCS